MVTGKRLFVYNPPLKPHPFRLQKKHIGLVSKHTSRYYDWPLKTLTQQPTDNLNGNLTEGLYGALVAASGGSDTAGCSPRVSARWAQDADRAL